MNGKPFARMWFLTLTDRDRAILRWMNAVICVFMATLIVKELNTADASRFIQNVGMLMWMMAYGLGPRCWGIVEAQEGSRTRKALTLISVLGFGLLFGASLVRYLTN